MEPRARVSSAPTDDDDLADLVVGVDEDSVATLWEGELLEASSVLLLTDDAVAAESDEGRVATLVDLEELARDGVDSTYWWIKNR